MTVGNIARGLTRSGVAAIEELFAAHIARGWHPGAQLAVYRGGELVMDIVGGEAALGQRLTRHHRMLLFSSTKPLMAIAVLRLVEQRRLRLDDRVATYWPEFAAGGKAWRRCAARSHRAAVHSCPGLRPQPGGRWSTRCARWPRCGPVGAWTTWATIRSRHWLLESCCGADCRMPRPVPRATSCSRRWAEGELDRPEPRDLQMRAPVHAMSR
jgi:hypothetical protein